jgi:ethanolaminephosphotransferase
MEVDKSYVSKYILRPYWEWVTANLVPLWIAPNLITLLGTVGIFFSYALALLYSTPRLDQPVPRSLNFIFAIALWTYSTLDNVDGKQARRTGSSSPLGELFDHGCDALVTGMGCVMQMAALGLGGTRYAVVAVALAFWSFYVPTWEEYETGTLYLGVVNGPTEGIISLCIIYVLTGMFGAEFWDTTVMGGWLLKDVSAVGLIASFIFFSLPTSVYNVYRASKGGRSFPNSLLNLTPLFSLSLSTGILFYKHSQPTLDCLSLLTGLLTVLFGRLATLVIYAHLTKLPYPSLPPVCLPLWLSPLLFSVVDAAVWMKPFLVVYFVFALLDYSNWVYHTINSFTAFLNIDCFTLPSPKNASNMKAAASKDINGVGKPTFADILKSAPLAVN